MAGSQFLCYRPKWCIGYPAILWQESILHYLYLICNCSLYLVCICRSHIRYVPVDTRDDLYDDVEMKDIIPGMYKSSSDQPPSLLQLCIDNRRENIARYLINNGVDMWEDVVVSLF